MMKTAEIPIRDPFVLPDKTEGVYYLFGTTDHWPWDGPAQGFTCYRSRDLFEWEGPIPAFSPPPGFWATTNFWAPEVHRFNGRYYMLASFKADKRYRGTQILVADEPAGPYAPLTDGPVTPPDWQCLDGTLYVDQRGVPWIVFCHEWLQIHNGSICAMPLTSDLKQPSGRPVYLFSASEAPWGARSDWPSGDDPHKAFPTYVTDGPFLHRTARGGLLMLWSTFGKAGYAMGYARSESGDIAGPWRQTPDPLWEKDGGHGMLFRAFDGKLILTFHQPNSPPREERAVFVEVHEKGNDLFLGDALNVSVH